MSPPVPPPPELLRYKVPLLMISAAYIVVLLLGIVAGTLQNALNDIFVAVAALLMALRAERCMGQCVMPFLLFAGIAVIFDALGVFTTLAQGYPGPDSFFASSCPRNSTITLLKNTTVYLQAEHGAPPDDGAYTLPKNTSALRKEDVCDWQWVLANAVALLSVLMDVVSTALAWRIFKAAGGASGLMGPGLAGNDPGAGFGALGGGPPGAPGGGGGGPGGFRPGGPRSGAAQEMQSSRQAGFTPFSGAGQSLNS